jgi:hypothetical protein
MEIHTTPTWINYENTPLWHQVPKRGGPSIIITMWSVGRRRRVVFLGLTTTKVLIVDVGRGRPIHHGCVAVDLPRVVEDRWRREVIGLRTGVCSMLC